MKHVTVALAILEKEARLYTAVQLGAYIGNTENDPLYSHFSQPCNGRLLALEPIKEYFDQLQANYAKCPWVRCENLAVAETSGPAEMYRLQNPNDSPIPDWMNQLSSLKKDRMEGLWDQYERQLPGVGFSREFYLHNRVTEAVQTVTLAGLMNLAKLSEIDLLQIDVEGYEAEILDQLDFPVRYLNYEHALMNPVDDTRILFDLEAKGYTSVRDGADTFAWKSGDVIEQVLANMEAMQA